MLVERGPGPGRPLGMDSGEVTTDDSEFDAPPTPTPRFGGGANEWIVRLPWQRRGVRMLPLSEIDLEHRSWLPHSGWPLDWKELERYYESAHQLLGLGTFDPQPEKWESARSPRLPMEPYGLTTAIERFARADVFTSRAWDAMQRSQNIQVCLNASVGALVGNDGKIEAVEIDHGARARFLVSAKIFVLASSGFENPRLLLASDDGRGIGNPHDVAGRYYMDHLRVVGGTVTPNDPRRFEQLSLYDVESDSGKTRMGKLVPSESYMRETQLLNSGAMMLPKFSQEHHDTIAQVASAAASLRSGKLPAAWPNAGAAARVGSRLVGTAALMAAHQRRWRPRTDAGWSTLRGNRRRWSTLEIEHQLELVPDPSNRLRLNDRVDDFGRPQLTVEWKWNEMELDSFRRTQSLFEDAFARSDFGRYVPTAWDDRPSSSTPGGAFHPMGGTRMHPDPRRGVVDATAQVHDWHNLFVAGSSVFPTGGYANPTLTVIALALRLGDEIERRLSSRPRVAS